jgi:hypothetical protein
LSIDIADVDVGENIGAKLQTEQAEADKRVAQAKAEVRRAAAVAVEQECERTQEMGESGRGRGSSRKRWPTFRSAVSASWTTSG